MRQNFNASLARLLEHEGGYTNHPSDPGGPTNFGITIHDYRKYIDANGTASDVKSMSVEQAKTIYRQKYWDAQKCDELPSGVDYAVFDYGVNSGIGRSGKVLRRLLDLPDNTHVVTAAVVAAANGADASALVNKICDERLAFLRRLKTWPTFGKGWGRRVSEVRKTALGMAGDKPSEKGQIEKLGKSKTVWASIGTFVAGIAAAIADADWKVWAVVIAGGLVAYIIYERSKKP